MVGYRVLQQVQSQFFIFLMLNVPFVDRVCGLLLLKSFKDGLVLYCDLDKLLLSSVTVEAANFESLGVIKFWFLVLHNV
jgi:hypothetical protein